MNDEEYKKKQEEKKSSIIVFTVVGLSLLMALVYLVVNR